MRSRERHILHSVEEFHARIEELELDQEDRLITADVTDFFVVGVITGTWRGWQHQSWNKDRGEFPG